MVKFPSTYAIKKPISVSIDHREKWFILNEIIKWFIACKLANDYVHLCNEP